MVLSGKVEVIVGVVDVMFCVFVVRRSNSVVLFQVFGVVVDISDLEVGEGFSVGDVVEFLQGVDEERYLNVVFMVFGLVGEFFLDVGSFFGQDVLNDNMIGMFF